MTAAKKDTEPLLEVSESGVEQAPQAQAEYPRTFTNRNGAERVIHSVAQQVAAEYDGYTAK